MKPEAAARTLAAQQDQEVNPKGFDKVFGEEEEDNGQKGTFYKKRQPKGADGATQSAVLTSAQTYGWRQPIDTFSHPNNRSGMCKRTFHDTGHL